MTVNFCMNSTWARCQSVTSSLDLVCFVLRISFGNHFIISCVNQVKTVFESRTHPVHCMYFPMWKVFSFMTCRVWNYAVYYKFRSKQTSYCNFFQSIFAFCRILEVIWPAKKSSLSTLSYEKVLVVISFNKIESESEKPASFLVCSVCMKVNSSTLTAALSGMRNESSAEKLVLLMIHFIYGRLSKWNSCFQISTFWSSLTSLWLLGI